MRVHQVAPAVCLAAVVLSACSPAVPAARPQSQASRSPTAGHDHSHDGVSMLVGDGTRGNEVGYTLRHIQLPETPGQPGEVSFEIERYDGAPVTDYLPDHTKDLHLYVVRDDLAVFRHLHPTQAGDGTWSGTVTLPEPGVYRVVTEFVARDEAGSGDHVMLGRSAVVGGDWTHAPPDVGSTNDDGVIEVQAGPGLRAGPDGRLDLVVTDARGHPVVLGSYLGAQAHVVGISESDGSVVHLHPTGRGARGDGGTQLTFVTELAQPGPYLFFVQVRVDDFLHTVPVRVEVPN
ncbi:hypothetical protein [Nocardioides bigeumensis]|uniref:Secreted protein n=1 Tax=Nocardioides bigeumensis TaxID=433657 RepID=A0ABN2Y5Z5_9ACTN